MSPEQIDGADLGPRSDLFSFGSVLYFMATGKSPFAGSSLTAILKAVTLDKPMDVRKRNPAVAVPIEQLIQDLHAKKPEDRPASASVVIERLEATHTLSLEPRAVQTTVVLAPPSSSSRAWQCRWWLVGIAAILVIALLLCWPDGKKSPIVVNSASVQNDPVEEPAKLVPLSLSLDIQVWKQRRGLGCP